MQTSQLPNPAILWHPGHSFLKGKIIYITIFTNIILVLKKRNAHFFAVLFRASNVVWHCTSTQQCQTPCGTPHRTVPHLQQHPNFPLAFHVPRLKPKHTHLEQVGETCSRQWMPLQMCVNCFRHSSRSGWPPQHKWFTTWFSPCLRDVEQLLILEEYAPLPPYWCVCSSVIKYCVIEFFLVRKVLKSWTLTWINWRMKFYEPNFFVEFSNLSSIKN